MLNRLLNMIKCKKTFLRKSSMTSGNAYMVMLSYHGKRISFIFNDNFENKSDKKDFLYCLVLDAQAYENSRDVADFMREFGYEDYAEAKKVRDACYRQSERLHKLFNRQEIDILSQIE